MKRNPKLHYLPENQTTPDIYAARTRLPEGFYLGESCFYEWTITLTLGGRARLQTAANQAFDVLPGHLVLTRSHAWHAWQAMRDETANRSSSSSPKGWDIAYSVFNPRPHWSSWLDGFRYSDGIAQWQFDGKARAELERAMLYLARIYATNSLLRDDRAMAALEMVLITLAERTEGIRIIPDPRMRDAVDAIHDRFAESLNVSELASAAHLSTPHFSALFTASIGMPPGQYVEHVRLDCAAEKLRFGTESIGDIARAVGYPEPKYFAHRFRLRFGHTPREFRRITRGGTGLSPE